jgi:SOUL heme-binding protein
MQPVIKTLLSIITLSIGILIYHSAMAIEEPNYKLLRSEPPYELREYTPMIIAEVSVDGDLDSAGSRGFRKLAGYIFGRNTAAATKAGSQAIAMTAPVVMQANPSTPQRIEMTAPVVMSATSSPQWRMHFVMPSQYQQKDLPIPLDPDVRIIALPAKRYAVLRFSGFNSLEKTEKLAQELRT